MNQRKQRAQQMTETIGYATQFESDKFRVRSQTNPSKSYIVTKTDNGLICECKDHEIRKADCKHIKIVLQIIMKNKCYRITPLESWNAQSYSYASIVIQEK